MPKLPSGQQRKSRIARQQGGMAVLPCVGLASALTPRLPRVPRDHQERTHNVVATTTEPQVGYQHDSSRRGARRLQILVARGATRGGSQSAVTCSAAVASGSTNAPTASGRNPSLTSLEAGTSVRLLFQRCGGSLFSFKSRQRCISEPKPRQRRCPSFHRNMVMICRG